MADKIETTEKYYKELMETPLLKSMREVRDNMGIEEAKNGKKPITDPYAYSRKAANKTGKPQMSYGTDKNGKIVNVKIYPNNSKPDEIIP
jgi:hypothetical protein